MAETENEVKRPIRIANFSGMIGDYFEALHNAVHGEPVDVLVGDYLAELTMGRISENYLDAGRPEAIQDYYVSFFLKQISTELEEIQNRGLKVVTNAGAFAPEAMAQVIRDMIAERGLTLRVAHITGDNILPRVSELAAQGQMQNMDSGETLGNGAARFVAANAYLGGWGIAAALEGGADIVICGRVTDASLAVGPAAWWHGWETHEWDKLAGACAAGHIIECGPQAMGGNFSGFTDIGTEKRLGFPIAEIDWKGDTVITKRATESGRVTINTVKAQLNYEIQGPEYINPDVVLHVDTIQLSEAGPDRIKMSGTKGSPAPETTKANCFYHNGFRTMMLAYITGRDGGQKTEWLRGQMQEIADKFPLDDYRFDPMGQVPEDPKSQREATMPIRIAIAAQDKRTIKSFMADFGGLWLGSLPGFHGENAAKVTSRAEFWPGLVLQSELTHHAVFEGGQHIKAAVPPTKAFIRTPPPKSGDWDAKDYGPTKPVPFGDVVHARSGDKGANANLGVWTHNPEAADWLSGFLTTETFTSLIEVSGDITVERYPMNNIGGVYFVLKNYFGTSGTSNIGLDQIGKGLGEFLRSRIVDVPVQFLNQPAIN